MITIEHLTKKYGEHTAVDDLNLTIEPGRIYGFLGPNGAGKSTTMNIITGYLAATEGTVTIDGHDIFKEAGKAKALIGYLPEIPPLYPDMTVLEYLEFAAELKGIKKADREREVDEACITTGISDVAGRLIRNLSKGYKQRVGIAQAILGRPEIIILDEPTAGLDPAQIIEVRDLIRDLGKDHTVILSSHILSEISEVCSYVFIISKGHLVASDDTDKLLSSMNGKRQTEIVVADRAGAALSPEGIRDIYASIAGVESVTVSENAEDGGIALNITSPAEKDIRTEVFDTTVKNGYILHRMVDHARSLEDVFIELTQTDEESALDDTADAASDDNADQDVSDSAEEEGGDEE